MGLYIIFKPEHPWALWSSPGIPRIKVEDRKLTRCTEGKIDRQHFYEETYFLSLI